MRKIVRGKIGEESDENERIESDEEEVRIGNRMEVERKELDGSDGGNERWEEIGKDEERKEEKKMRREDKKVDMIVSGVGDGKWWKVEGGVGVMVGM